MDDHTTTFAPPPEARELARQALRVREAMGVGGSEFDAELARRIADGADLTRGDLMMLAGYFSRHADMAGPRRAGGAPTPREIAYGLRGGEPMRRHAFKELGKADLSRYAIDAENGRFGHRATPGDLVAYDGHEGREKGTIRQVYVDGVINDYDLTGGQAMAVSPKDPAVVVEPLREEGGVLVSTGERVALKLREVDLVRSAEDIARDFSVRRTGPDGFAQPKADLVADERGVIGIVPTFGGVEANTPADFTAEQHAGWLRAQQVHVAPQPTALPPVDLASSAAYPGLERKPGKRFLGASVEKELQEGLGALGGVAGVTRAGQILGLADAPAGDGVDMVNGSPRPSAVSARIEGNDVSVLGALRGKLEALSAKAVAVVPTATRRRSLVSGPPTVDLTDPLGVLLLDPGFVGAAGSPARGDTLVLGVLDLTTGLEAGLQGGASDEVIAEALSTDTYLGGDLGVALEFSHKPNEVVLGRVVGCVDAHDRIVALAADLSNARIMEAVDLASSASYPGLDRKPGDKNWVSKAGGLPSYIERIAKHLHYEEGMNIGRSIAVAVNHVKRMCASGDTNLPGSQQVNPKSRAEACAAVASWEKKKASTKKDMTSEDLAYIMRSINPRAGATAEGMAHDMTGDAWTSRSINAAPSAGSGSPDRSSATDLTATASPSAPHATPSGNDAAELLIQTLARKSASMNPVRRFASAIASAESSGSTESPEPRWSDFSNASEDVALYASGISVEPSTWTTIMGPAASEGSSADDATLASRAWEILEQASPEQRSTLDALLADFTDVGLPGKQSVNPKARAEACKAVAEWEGKKAKAKADMAREPDLAEAVADGFAFEEPGMPGELAVTADLARENPYMIGLEGPVDAGPQIDPGGRLGFIID